ncbi:hypothetical protein, partial [Streptomyces sp. GC420]|uniref:hypothetical protein n=1 Tax=Streptomyces sp. GC420 TaxID=2697568 RepID=UPI001414D502
VGPPDEDLHEKGHARRLRLVNFVAEVGTTHQEAAGETRTPGGGAAGAFARDGDSVNGTAGSDGVVIIYLYG